MVCSARRSLVKIDFLMLKQHKIGKLYVSQIFFNYEIGVQYYTQIPSYNLLGVVSNPALDSTPPQMFIKFLVSVHNILFGYILEFYLHKSLNPYSDV